MKRLNIFTSIFIVSSLLQLQSCSTYKNYQGVPRNTGDIPMVAPARSQQNSFSKDNIAEMKKLDPALVPPKTPDFQPVSDDISPAKSRIVNIQARNTTLGDILHVIADSAGLNLIIGSGIDLERPVTITLKRVSADDALNTILASMDYLYTLKGNILTVEATATRTFEIAHPALIQSYNVDVGGDILGGAASSGGGGSSSSNIKGTVSKTLKSDTKAFDFWEALEKNLNTIIGKPESSSGATASHASRNAAAQSPVAPAGLPQTALSAQQTIPLASAAHDSQTGPQQGIVINRLTGTVVVTATRNNLARVETYIDNLKKALNRQVLVEARIIEVQLNDALQFGINWEFLKYAKWFNSYSAISSGFGDVTTAAADALKNGSFRLGYAGSGVQTLLTALKTQGEVRTLSNPRINVMNGQTAILSVGRNENYIAKVTSTTTTTAGSAPTVTYTVDIGNVLSGIIIGLVPHINNKGEIRLTITPIVSNRVKFDTKSFGSDATGGKVELSIPTIDLRELSTTVKVRNGELIVIGGLIDNKQNYSDKKIPLLGDIPWLGALFTNKDNQDSRSELVVILQPYLISND